MDDRERAQMERIKGLVDEARSIAPGAIVFGSTTRPGLPNDLDLMLEADPESREARGLLALARRNYGWVDVFVKPPSGRLLVRNDLATGWTMARNACGIASAAKRDGVRLDRFVLPVSPVEDEAPRNVSPGP